MTKELRAEGPRRRRRRQPDAPARRIRAGLPVRRLGGPADRRAPGRAARRRLRRWRDVSRLRRAGARALHRRDHLSRGRRLGDPVPQGRRCPRRRRKRSSASARRPRRRVRRRQGQLPPLHGQGDPRAAGGRGPHSGPLPRHGDRARRAALHAAVRLARPRPHGRSRPAAPPITPASSPSTGSSASPACRSRSTSRPSSATARPRCPHGPGALRIPVRRDGRHARRAALREGAGAAHPVGRQRPHLVHRPRERRGGPDAGRPGDRRRLHQGLHLPAHRARLPRGGRRPRPRHADAEQGEASSASSSRCPA